MAWKECGSVLLWAAFLAAPASAQTIVSRIDLSRPFGARPGWRFLAFQGPATADDFEADGRAPGAIRLCITNDGGRSCNPDLSPLLSINNGTDGYSQALFLNEARILRTATGQAIFLVQVASAHSGNGNQRVTTAALTYDRTRNAFRLAYAKEVGHNNNEEVRYIEVGPLRGAIVSAAPTFDAPFGFWITVNRLVPAGRYQQVLRYRSATHYGDGNRLAVIDSEMPNIQQRLGLWHPGQPLLRPARGCRRPRLIRRELWC
jgi:hypothetical protein